jgi:arylsulfatase A-like enzyme
MLKDKNIIILIADSLRYDSVFSPGNKNGGLPALFNESCVYPNAFSSGCWTLPATASIFTGKLPHEHKATTRTRMKLDPDTPFITELLKKKGYECIQVTANPVTTHIFGLDRGFDRVERSWLNFEFGNQPAINTMLLLGKRRIRKRFLKGDFITGKITEDVQAGRSWFNSFAEQQMARSIEILEQNRDRGTPTFLFINLMETHFPYHIDNRFKTLSRGIFSKVNEIKSLYHLANQSWLKTGKRYISPYMLDLLKRRQKLSWQRLSTKVDSFFQIIRKMFPATLFIFGADHGDNFGDEGWRYHFSNLTEAGTRIPLFISPPDQNENRIVKKPVSNRRLFNYILDFVESSDGINPLKRNENIPLLQSFWYDLQGSTHPQYQIDQFGFVHQKYRYIENKTWKRYKIDRLTKKFPEGQEIDGNPVYDLNLTPAIQDRLEKKYHKFKNFSKII